MPLYEYKCDSCGHVVEIIIPSWRTEYKMNVGCSQCRPGVLVRQPSAPSVQFKGTGFYENDYKEKK